MNEEQWKYKRKQAMQACEVVSCVSLLLGKDELVLLKQESGQCCVYLDFGYDSSQQ